MTRNLRTQLVAQAEHALRCWHGDDMTREQAAALLPKWRFAVGLDDDLRTEVLSRFSPAEPPSVPGLDWLPEVEADAKQIVAEVVAGVPRVREFHDDHGCTWREHASGQLVLLDANGKDSGLRKDHIVVERLYGPLVEVVPQPDAEAVDRG
jgi:hypothetical protein